MKKLLSSIFSGNNYDRMELAGAFGDFGTLLPYVLVYMTVLGFDPVAVLFAFGLTNIATGLFYKTPVPVQPMKAIGTAALTHAGQITQGMVWGAGIFTGIFWLILAATGALKHIARIVGKPVTKGIVLGLGLSFIYQSLKMMGTAPLIAGIGLVIVVVLLNNTKVPAVFALLIFGIVAAVVMKPEMLATLKTVRPSVSLPLFEWGRFTFNEFLNGTLILGLAQLPLTLGNGVIALAAENNRLFPERSTSERKIAVSTGLINLLSPFLGGVPMCHGAGGMAGHVRFGAHTGGATVMLGMILLGLAVFFGGFLSFFLQLFPPAILGVLVFMAGIQLAAPVRGTGYAKSEIVILGITAGISLWNMGIALLVGMVLDHCWRVYIKNRNAN